MQRTWLIFAQATTVAVAVLFVVSTFRPEWLPSRSIGNHVAVVQQAPTTGPLPGVPAGGSFNTAVQRAAPSVVNIFTSKEIRSPRHPLLNDPIFRRFFGEQMPEDAQRASSLGSGVIVSNTGYVLTNHHVVEAADEIEIGLHDGKKLLAKVVGNDPETDLAVLRLNAENLPAITFGSSDALKVGDVVLAIGNPFGVGQTVTSGIVSALGRNQLGINNFENFIQTDAAINPGNSGGALIDVSGNLLGVNTAIYSRSGGSMGIGFAIPVSMAKIVLEGIVKEGQVRRGWIGVEPNELSPELAETFGVKADTGVIITGVLQNGPAAKAGIRPGDVLIKMDDRDLEGMEDFLDELRQHKAGDQVQVSLLRNGQQQQLQVTLAERPPG